MINELINSMEICSSLEGSISSATQEIPRAVWTPLLHVLQKMNAVHVPPDSFYYIPSKTQVFQVASFLQFFYICSSVHRNPRLKKSNKMQQNADIHLLLNYSTCFGRPSHPSSGVHKTVVAASGTDRTIWEGNFFKRDQIRTHLVTFEEACCPDSMICTRGCNYSFMYS